MTLPVLLAILIAGQIPTFRSRVDMVGITITAVDVKTGAPVAGLQESDFTVLEDGVPQRLTHFKQEDAPASVLVLMDVSSSVARLAPDIRRAVARLISSLRSGDEVQVVQFASQYQELTDFTIDHATGVAALEQGFVRDDETFLTRSLLTATVSLEHRFPEDVERRRIILLLSDGENTSGSFSPASVLDRIRRSGVVCYVVHIARAYITGNDRIENAQAFMQSIARESGGHLVTASFAQPWQLARAYAGIADELGTQYHVAYESNATEPGWHAIGIMLRRRSDVTLRYRRAFYVPRSR